MNLIKLMSEACMRKIVKDKDNEIRTRLINAYKSLLKISINLNSKSNLASLLYEGEKRLKEILKVNNVLIIVYESESKDKFVKLN
jgi:hypothetical protein